MWKYDWVVFSCWDPKNMSDVLYVCKVKVLFFFRTCEGTSSSSDSPQPSSNACERRSIYSPPTTNIQSLEVCVHVPQLCKSLALQQTIMRMLMLIKEAITVRKACSLMLYLTLSPRG